jgi:uncharacterized MAPEG superfamily protein
MSAVTLELTSEHGYAIAVLLALWFQHNIIFVVKVAMARFKFGIQPPTIYPRDSEIKAANLTQAQVDEYMCAQRVHQNNVEFLSAFFPVMLIAMVENPTHTAYAGAVVWLGRMMTAIGYWGGAKKRVIGGWFHFGELYTVYLAANTAYKLITK